MSDAMMTSVCMLPEDDRPIVDALTAEDFPAWERLWQGYLTFYEVTLPQDITAHTWERIISTPPAILGRAARLNGELVGFSLSVLHASTWVKTPVCYLEDLFVDPACRSKGVGSALIDDLLGLTAINEWSRLYWHTHRKNETARALYDRYTKADDTVLYRIHFTES